MGIGPSFPILDVLAAPFWLGTNTLLGLAVWRLGRALFPQDGPAECAAHGLVLGWACIVGSATALGSIGMLTGPRLLALVATVSGLLLIAGRRLAGDRGRSGRGAPPAPEATGRGRRDAWGMLWLYLACYWAAHVAIEGIGRLPRDWDSLHYHIPMISHWLQARSLYAPSGDNWSTPGNNELLGLWMVGPFSGDFLIGLNNLPAVALLTVSALGLGAELGLSRASRNLTALVMVANGAVMNQLVDQKNDVAVAALFLGTAFYGLRYARTRHLADAALAGAALGLLSGVKYFALGYAAVASLWLIGLAWALLGLRDTLRLALMLAAGLLIWGGYWYARNYLAGGSLFYPLMAPDSGEAATLPKMHTNVWITTLYSHRGVEVVALYATKVLEWMGPLHFAALAVLPTTLGWLLIGGFGSWWDIGKRREGILRVALVLLVAGAGAVLSATPFAVGNSPGDRHGLERGYSTCRYGLCFLGLTVLAAAVALQDAAPSRRRRGPAAPPDAKPGAAGAAAIPARPDVPWGRTNILTIIIILFSVYSATIYESSFRGERTGPWLAHVVGFDLVLLAFGAAASRRRRLPLGSFLSCAVAACLVAGAAAGWLSRRWHDGFPGYYDDLLKTGSFSALSGMDPTSVRIATFCERPYPFFGSARQFTVVQPLPMQRLPTYPWLLRVMEDEDIDLVAARSYFRPQYRRFNEINGWLSDHPRAFRRITQGGEIRLYRVNQPSSEGIPRGQAASAPPRPGPLGARNPSIAVPGTPGRRRSPHGRRAS